LSTCHEIAELLLREHRNRHQALVNSCRKDPHVYSPGDILFARRATRSDSFCERVGKLEYKFTGRWRVLESLHGGSYSLEHCLHPKRTEKKHASDLTPYPPELVPFKPVDGADTCYGQLYRPIGENPFKDAGLKGFTPPIPLRATNLFLDVGNFKDFRWPMLSELNDELDPFPWQDDDARYHFMMDESPFRPPEMYNGPPPSPPEPATPSLSPPSITELAPCIIASMDELFFIAHAIGKAKREWRFVQVAFNDSNALYPSALWDGRFFVKFYIWHPADVRYNATNQRFWLQYCPRNGVSHGHLDAHLIAPSDASEERATCHHLLPIRCWANLTHANTYIHGPFDFATVNGRETRDRVDMEAWNALAANSLMFCNATPCFDLPSYSIHVDHGIHMTHRMIAVAPDHLLPPLPTAQLGLDI
jgi:hypothetical protein